MTVKKGSLAKKTEPKYYSSAAIRQLKAVYNVIYGSRSFGKTYDMFYNAVTAYWEARKTRDIAQWAYLRRSAEDLKGENIRTAGDTLVCNGEGKNVVEDITEGMFNTIVYDKKCWYLAKKNPETGTLKKDVNPFMLAFSFTDYKHKKGGAFPFVTDIWFEEFIGVVGERISKDEFVIFQNIISTIARGRHVRIWMTGNSINPFSPYWDWMGLTNASKQKPGTIEKYKIGKTDKIIAVERTIERKEYAESKTSNSYLFAFDDPRLKMITTGEWEISDYPLLEDDVKSEDICGRFFIEHKGVYYQADIVSGQDDMFIYIHKYIDPLDPIDYDYDLIYSLTPNAKSNYRVRLDQALTEPERWIKTLFLMGRIFYDENWTGVAVSDYRSTSVRVA